jgi:hypothetical protein
MQNRRIIDGIFLRAGGTPRPPFETLSLLTVCAHVALGGWATTVTNPRLFFLSPPTSANSCGELSCCSRSRATPPRRSEYAVGVSPHRPLAHSPGAQEDERARQDDGTRQIVEQIVRLARPGSGQPSLWLLSRRGEGDRKTRRRGRYGGQRQGSLPSAVAGWSARQRRWSAVSARVGSCSGTGRRADHENWSRLDGDDVVIGSTESAPGQSCWRIWLRCGVAVFGFWGFQPLSARARNNLALKVRGTRATCSPTALQTDLTPTLVHSSCESDG